MVGPDYVRRDPPVPEHYSSAALSAGNNTLEAPSGEATDLSRWWQLFEDPELDALVQRALAQNLDRQAAASRIREAREAITVARAPLFPMVNGDASATHTHISQHAGLSSFSSLLAGAGGAGGGVSSTPATPDSGIATAGSSGMAFNTYEAGFDAAWELDFFGGTRRAARAASARAEAEVWSARDTDISLVAEVAREYLSLRTDQERLDALQKNIASQRKLLDIIDALWRGGLANDIDVAQQRTQLASSEAGIAPLESSADTHRHAVELLLALAPDSLQTELAAGSSRVAGTLPAIPVGLPSELLKRRPDLRQAERQLAAATEDVGQATAALYPKIELTGSFDFVSTSLRTLLEWSSRNYSYAANLTTPIFNGGKLRAQKREAEEKMNQAEIAYRQAVLGALREVADQLSMYGADQRRLLKLESGLVDATVAEKLNRAQYLGGLADQQATLRAEAAALQTEDELVQTRGQLSTDLIGLFKALGGGWSPDAGVGSVTSDRLSAGR